ncbi:MAG TPA: cell division protein ZapE [Methylovirgula sp.]
MTKGLSAPASPVVARLAYQDVVDLDGVQGPLLECYLARVAQGQIELDRAQEQAVRALDRLNLVLTSYRPVKKSASLSRLFTRSAAAAPFGLYIWGSVGRGKTMLMDLFFEETGQPHKKRQHFHAFMADVPARIFAVRQQMKEGVLKGDDPIAPVADAIADEATLICLDEFTVTDIADAMILGRLLQNLFARGVVIVATSNVHPEDLYRDGLNRALFLPCIDLLQERMDALNLAARTDFRLEKLIGETVYHVPADFKAHAALTSAFRSLTGAAHGPEGHIEVLGRSITVPQSRGHVARFKFGDLCAQALGSRDFLAIAENFHTVIIDAIPVIRPDQADVAKRFILLVDALYDQHVKLIVSAEAEPADLYRATEGREAFEFSRTVSRLIEMRSAAYLGLAHGTIHTVEATEAPKAAE